LHSIKANLTKVRDAKPRVLASSATFERHEEPKIAGPPLILVNRRDLLPALVLYIPSGV
jgi:hypothetical protein